MHQRHSIMLIGAKVSKQCTHTVLVIFHFVYRYMHRVQWNPIANMFLCSVHRCSLLQAQLRAQCRSPFRGIGRLQRPGKSGRPSGQGGPGGQGSLGGQWDCENMRFCGPGRTLDRENMWFRGSERMGEGGRKLRPAFPKLR